MAFLAKQIQARLIRQPSAAKGIATGGFECGLLHEKLFVGQFSDRDDSLATRLTTLHLALCAEAPVSDPGPNRVHGNGNGKVHQPGIEPRSHRWQRCILPLDH